MASQKPHGTLLKEVLAGKEASLPRTLLSELLELPAARSFPLMAGIKRGREPAAAATRWLADAAAGLTLKSSPPLDATGLLLVEAATQLSWLVKQQLQRRTLRAVRSSCDAGSDSDSDGGATAGKSAGGCGSGSQGAGSPRGIHAACTGSTSVATISAGASAGASGPCSAPISLPRCKRICLERQYAIDLTGHCLMAGQRVLLPSADSFAGVQSAPSGGTE